MKKQLDAKVLIAALGVVVLALLVTAWAVFRPFGNLNKTPTNYTQG